MAIDSMVYPDIVAQFAGFLGGIEAKTGEQEMNCRIGGVRDLDLSGIDPSVNNSEYNAKVYDLFSLSDTTVVKGYFWFTQYTVSGNSYERLNARFKLYNRSTGQSKDTNGSYPSGSGYWIEGFCEQQIDGITSGEYFRCNSTLLQTYKAKMCLITEYYNGVWTHPNGYGIVILFPTANTKFPATFQTWSHIVRGAMGNSWYRSYVDPAPSGSIYYPWRGAGETVLWISDETHFENWVKKYDPEFKISDIRDVGEVDDPIQDLDPSEPGGGEGNYDEGSDPVDFPALPTGGALASGGCKAYLVTSTNLKAIFNKLWSTTSFDISTFQKLYDCPMDSIISLHALPVTPHNITSNDIYIGNFNTEIRDRVVSNQYLAVDCGSIDVKEFWGSALDYNPYTKAELFLPFVGIKEVDIDDVMDKTVHIKYNIDILTGDCIANVKCGASVLYKYAGNMKQNIPVSGKTSNLDLNGIQGVFSTIAGAAMGTAVGGPVGTAIGVGAGLSAAAGVVGSKVTTQRASGLTGNVGILDDYVPYIILHRPIQSLANKFKSYKGYPSNITAKLSTVTGYTEVEYVNLQGIPNATSEEMDEIKSLLQSGVII